MTNLVPKKMPSASKNEDTNRGLLSVRLVFGIPFETIQCSRKIFSSTAAVKFAHGIARVSLQFRSVIRTMNLFPCLAYVSGPSI